MTKGHLRSVGRTDLSLPRLGFGGAPLGELYRRVPEPVAQATLQKAWDLGVRYYDTAPLYGRGLSEHQLGGCLRTRPRSEFVLTTKVGRILYRPPDPAHFDRSPWAGGLNFDFRYDYTYDGFMRSYEQSLQRLSLDTIDALVIHDLDAGFHGDELPLYTHQLVTSGIKALEELKRSGDIKAFGIGVNNDQAFREVAFVVDVDFCLVAMPYTLLDQKTLDLMNRCAEQGISVIIGAPFASGILVTGSRTDLPHYSYGRAPEDVQDKVRRIEAVCGRHNIPLPAAALQFVLAHPAVVSVIPGAMSGEEVAQNAGFLDAVIPGQFWSELREQGLVDPGAPLPS